MGASVAEQHGESIPSPAGPTDRPLRLAGSEPVAVSARGAAGGSAGDALGGQPDPADAAKIAATVAAAAGGDQAAWAELVRVFAGRVFAMVRSRVRDPELAEEITQSVFTTVARQLGDGGPVAEGGYREQGRFEAWLFRIALNRVRDEGRRRRRRGVLQERIAAEPKFRGETDPAGAPTGADTGELDRMRDAIAQLGEKDREVIELRHHAQMSFKQIAAALGEPVGTLLARHHRALRKLRDMIEEAGSGAQPESGR